MAWSVAASRISSNMSRRLLQAAPSAPSDTEMPRARISTTGAMPEPSFRFEPGQWRTLTSRSASSCLFGFGHPDAVRRTQPRRCEAGVREILEVRQPARQLPHDFDFVPILRRVRMDERVFALRQCRDRLEQITRARHGEPRRERRAQPAARLRRAIAPSARGSRRSTSARLSCSRPRNLRRPSPSCTCRRSPRRPVSASVSKTTSVSCTVSIVSTVVVPVRSSSAAASRADARSVVGVCAASIGHTRRRSHSSSGMSSANPRKSVWHRWTCVWMKPGRR